MHKYQLINVYCSVRAVVWLFFSRFVVSCLKAENLFVLLFRQSQSQVVNKLIFRFRSLVVKQKEVEKLFVSSQHLAHYCALRLLLFIP